MCVCACGVLCVCKHVGCILNYRSIRNKIVVRRSVFTFGGCIQCECGMIKQGLWSFGGVQPCSVGIHMLYGGA